MAHGSDKQKIQELKQEGESPDISDPIHQAADQASDRMVEQVEGLTLSLFQQKLQSGAFGDSFRQKLQEILQETPQAFEARILEPGSNTKLLAPTK